MIFLKEINELNKNLPSDDEKIYTFYRCADIEPPAKITTFCTLSTIAMVAKCALPER
jgi:hypothetical protein